MKNDIIECLNCGKKFKDDTKQTDKLTEAGNTYQWKGQDSRETNSKGKQLFSNMCPFCYGTNTRNTHEKTKVKAKFINEVTHRDGGKEIVKHPKRVKKPILTTGYIVKEVLGTRQSCDVAEERKNFSIVYERTLPKSETPTLDFIERTGGTHKIAPVKPFTPIELMERKLNAQHKELLSPPDNCGKYRGWRYDKIIRKRVVA